MGGRVYIITLLFVENMNMITTNDKEQNKKKIEHTTELFL